MMRLRPCFCIGADGVCPRMGAWIARNTVVTAMQKTSSDPFAGENGGPGAILLVEDHPDSLYLLARLLRRSGYIVHEAATCADAITLAGREPISIVVVDIDLPDCSGLELLPRLRVGSPHLRGLALSAHTTEPHQFAALEAGYEHFLPKPFKFGILLDTIELLMNGNVNGLRSTNIS